MKINCICLLLCVLLCLGGCSVLGGNTTDPSSANPATENLSKSEESTPATATPAATTSEPSAAPAPVAFTLNHYALPADATTYLAEHSEEYKQFVDALLAYNDSFTFSSEAAKKAILGVIGRFPLSALCQPFDIDFATLKTPLAYTVPASEFKTLTTAFETAVTRFMENCLAEGNSEIENAISLYGAVAAYQYADTGESDAYHFFTEKQGSSFGFSGALSYLLSQIGSKTMLATSTTEANKEHRWVILEVAGKSYNMDPTFENGFSGGKGLSFFLMSDARREKTGCTIPYATGENGYFTKGAALCKDSQFDKIFANTGSWKLEQESHTLYLAQNGGDGFTSSLKTDPLEPIY